jgi:hypothetical protein
MRDRESLRRYSDLVNMHRLYNEWEIRMIALISDEPPLPENLTSETGKPVNPEQIAEVFSWNPFLADDFFLRYALEDKSTKKQLKKHHDMAALAYNMSMLESGIPVPPILPFTAEFIGLDAEHLVAANRVQDEIMIENFRIQEEIALLSIQEEIEATYSGGIKVTMQNGIHSERYQQFGTRL